MHMASQFTAAEKMVGLLLHECVMETASVLLWHMICCRSGRG